MLYLSNFHYATTLSLAIIPFNCMRVPSFSFFPFPHLHQLTKHHEQTLRRRLSHETRSAQTRREEILTRPSESCDQGRAGAWYARIIRDAVASDDTATTGIVRIRGRLHPAWEGGDGLFQFLHASAHCSVGVLRKIGRTALDFSYRAASSSVWRNQQQRKGNVWPAEVGK